MRASILAVKVKGLSRICQFFDLRTKYDHLGLFQLVICEWLLCTADAAEMKTSTQNFFLWKILGL